MVDGIAPLTQVEIAHLSLDAPGIAFAPAGDGADGADFRQQASEPGVPLPRGKWRRRPAIRRSTACPYRGASAA